MRRCLAVVALAACGRVGFSPPPDVGVDALAVADAPARVHPCDAPVLYRDSFDDGVAGPEWSVSSGEVAASETNGVLRLTFEPDVDNVAYGGYLLRAPLSAGSCVVAELTSAPVSPGYAYLAWGTALTDTKVELTSDQAGFLAWYQNGNTSDDVSGLGWDPTFRVQRMFDLDGEMHWELSTDGVTFIELGHAAMPSFDRTNATIRIGAGTTVPVANAGIAEWASVTVHAF